MDAYQITDALSVSFFALLAIWAAVVRRHWFLRFAVLGVCLLAALLISAHEVVIEYAIQVAIILTGVWLARGQSWQPRLSLETALLAMVVVAVVAAVVARIPGFSWSTWANLITTGVSTALLALLLLWIAAGQASLPVRLGCGALGFAALLVLYHFGRTLTDAIARAESGGDWKEHVIGSYRVDYLTGWARGQARAILMASVICLAAIALARASGWFTTPDSATRRRPVAMVAARIALVSIALLVVSPLSYLFYRLLTPQTLPADVPSPNGYDDLVAAGRLVPATMTTVTQALGNNGTPAPTDAQLEAELQSLQSVFDLIDAGLNRPGRMNLRTLVADASEKHEERRALHAAEEALWLRYAQKYRNGTTDEKADAVFKIYEFTHKAYHGTGVKWWDSATNQTPELVARELTTDFPQANAAQCRALARRLYELDNAGETLDEQVKLERILDSHKGWRHHMRLLLDDWSGYDTYDWWRSTHRRREKEVRSHILALAVRAYRLDHNEFPPDLAALCPEYLPTIPGDPYGTGPMKMKVTAEGAAIYSAGENGVDDGGLAHEVDAKGIINTKEADFVYLLDNDLKFGPSYRRSGTSPASAGK